MGCYLRTGQTTCHDSDGREIACEGTGQDAEFKRGVPWPGPRFETQGETILDRLTGLVWTKNGNLSDYPITWQEALAYVRAMNQKTMFGFSDWRLPNRRELKSLMSHQTRKPALPIGHPFHNVFSGWYWTSTTAAINPAYAWYVHMEGARMFFGSKAQYFLLWPVRREGLRVLPVTGQQLCYSEGGQIINCSGSGQDGEFRFGQAWPEPRFQASGEEAVDLLTGLHWHVKADITGQLVPWSDALSVVARMNSDVRGGGWRLPSINELESLVDCSTHSPALPDGHPFRDVREGYWSSTTSMFEPDWAWSLYLEKGAIGVGQKRGAYFSVWPVRD